MDKHQGSQFQNNWTDNHIQTPTAIEIYADTQFHTQAVV